MPGIGAIVGNTTVLVAIDGATLRAALENGFRDLGRPSGRFLQVSGMTVTLDPNAPPGRRVVSATVGGAPLEDARTYRVAANDFMLRGGNDYGIRANYGIFARGRVLIGGNDGKLLANEVMACLRTRSPLPAETEARIRDALPRCPVALSGQFSVIARRSRAIQGATQAGRGTLRHSETHSPAGSPDGSP
ncbi:MAG: 5'-nucleotidase [Methylorubrum populi]